MKAWLVGVTMLATAVPAWAQVEGPDEAAIRARQRLSMMEGVLERAVANGANSVQRQFREMLGEPPQFAGAPQVSGHRIDGFGVFLHVGVPILRMPIRWTMRSFTTDVMAADLARLRTIASGLSGRERDALEQIIGQLELQLGVLPSPASRTAQALNVGGGPAGEPIARPPVAPDSGGAPLEDPNDVYTREVMAAIIDAMIESSGMIDLEPNEWLVVAARDNVPRNPLVPSDLADFSTLQFRILGSDLEAYRAKRITLEEARSRVTVKEY